MWPEKLILITIALGVLLAMIFHFPLGVATAFAAFAGGVTAGLVMICFCLLHFVR